MITLISLGLLALSAGAAGSVTSCYSCASISAGPDYQRFAAAVQALFGQWPAQSKDCRSGPGLGEIAPCNSFCVTQTFSFRVPRDKNAAMSGIVRGCASTVLKGIAVNPPTGPGGASCAAHHIKPIANGLVVASVDTYPCTTSNCNGGPPNTALPYCDNPCGHNVCPSGACAQQFDKVSYSCGGAIPTKVPPTAVPSSSGWQKAANQLLEAIDPSVDPCQDFYAFSCNKWMKNHPIPAGSSSISSFGALQNSLINQVGTQLAMGMNSSSNTIWPAAVNKAHNLYQSCVNINGMNYNGSHFDTIIKQAGDWPILNETWSETEISLFKRSAALSRTFGVDTFITPSVDTDWRNPLNHALYLDQATLTFPAVFYNDPAFAPTIRNQLRSLMLNVTIAIAKANGRVIKPFQIIDDIDMMINLEFSIAKSIVPAAKSQSSAKQYNVYSVTNATSRWPQIQWGSWLGIFLETGAQNPGNFIVTKPQFFDALNNQLATIDSFSKPKVARTFQNYIIWRLVYSKMEFLTFLMGMENVRAAYLEARRQIEGIEELAATPNAACTSMVIGAMPYAASRLYIDFHFNRLPAHPRDFIQKMTTSVMGGFRQMVANLRWMDAATKATAINKVNNVLQNYAYPDWILDNAQLNAYYSGLNLQAGDILWVASSKVTDFQMAQFRAELKAPTNRRNWNGPPAIVNAWYQPELNSITFPAGILNPPFFEADFPDAMNYGGMGIVEGHELTHGFDNNGVQWGPLGRLGTWIDAQSEAGFQAMVNCVIAEYKSFCYKFPNMTQFCVSGKQTQGEDVADNGGMKAAYLAFKAAQLLNGPQPRLPGALSGYSNDQLFFMAFGRLWCEKKTPIALRQQINLDPHAPGRDRVIGAVRNFPPFQAAFNCPANAPMSPTMHCTVW